MVDLVEWSVEWGDRADDADRLPDGERHPVLAAGRGLHRHPFTVDPFRLLCGKQEGLPSAAGLDPGVLHRLAGFVADRPGKFVGPLADDCARPGEDLVALEWRQLGRSVDSRGCGDGSVDVIARCDRDSSEDTTVVGRADESRFARGPDRPLSVDEHGWPDRLIVGGRGSAGCLDRSRHQVPPSRAPRTAAERGPGRRRQSRSSGWVERRRVRHRSWTPSAHPARASRRPR